MLIIISFLLGIFSIILFTKYGYTNKKISFFASTMLFTACIIVMWLKFYSDIQPIWLGIAYAVFLFVAFIITSFIIRNLNINLGNLAAIPLVFVLALVINHFESKISGIILRIFKR
jgi:hypothetical protein